MGSAASKVIGTNLISQQQLMDVPSFKVVLVGDPMVGKTALFLRFTKEQFDYSYQPTMQVNIGTVTRKVNVPYESIVSVTVWDIPGREEIDLRRSYYRDIDAAIVVVDLSDTDSVEMSGTWKQDLMNNMFVTDESAGESVERRRSMLSQVQIPVLLLGNKLDTVAGAGGEPLDLDCLSPKPVQMLEEKAKQHGFVGCVCVSAKESDGGVHAAMTSLIRYLLTKRRPKKAVLKPHESQSLRGIFDPRLANSYDHILTTADEHIHVPLSKTNIPEIDAVFDKADKHVWVIEKASLSLVIATKNFRRACCVSGLTDTHKASVEECVIGLKDTLRSESDEEILLAREEAGYISLSIAPGAPQPVGPIQRVITVYTDEVCQATRRVLAHCPMAKVSLLALASDIDSFKEDAFDKALASGLPKAQAKRTVSLVMNNICRLNDAVFLADESMKVTSDYFKKVKNAMLW